MALLKEFELEDKFNLYPAQLSGGQRQRCAIIQQILCSEHFLLMDEPFSGLDLLMLEKTCELITKVADMDDLNTIIVVTHDVTAACSVADHLWLMGRDSRREWPQAARFPHRQGVQPDRTRSVLAARHHHHRDSSPTSFAKSKRNSGDYR